MSDPTAAFQERSTFHALHRAGWLRRVMTVSIVGLLLTAGAIAGMPRVGDLGLVDSRIAAAHSRLLFDQAVWQQGDSVRRGAMLADLARRHRFVGTHRDSVIAILGAGKECLVYFHDEPCYKLRLGHSSFELQFRLTHGDSSGRVIGMDMVRK